MLRSERCRKIDFHLEGAQISAALLGSVAEETLTSKAGVKLLLADYDKLRRAIHAHPAHSGIGWEAKTSGHGVSGCSASP